MEKMHIEKNTVQETLVIPLYGRKLCTERFPALFQDKRAVELIDRLNYDFSALERKSRSMGHQFGALEVAMRETDLLTEARDYLAGHPRATIVNLGCGLDQTAENADNGLCRIVNVDLPDVIAVRDRLLPGTERIRNLACDLNDLLWMDRIDARDGAVFFAAGVFYYFKNLGRKRKIWVLSIHEFTSFLAASFTLLMILEKEMYSGQMSSHLPQPTHI